MIWRYLIRRDMISYEPQLWGMVFPLGMYAASTYQLERGLELPFLEPIPHVFIILALVAWVGAFTGLTLRIARSFLLAREAAGRGAV
jgi:tellurite resistance protein TehA-like permease